MNDCHPSTEQPKATRLEALYEADGRHDPEHKYHGFFTGLHRQELERLSKKYNPEPAP